MMFNQGRMKILLAVSSFLLFSTSWERSALASDSFFDQFNYIDNKRWYISDGWNNGDWQNCEWSKRAVRASNGQLHLSFSEGVAKDRKYICGEIRTKTAFKYGTYEARIKTSAKIGLNAAFFTYTGPQAGTPHDEIDFENLLRDTKNISTGTYVNGVNTGASVAALPHGSDEGFIDYAFKWSATKVEWFVNGKLVREVSGKSVPSFAQNIFFSIWGTDTLTQWMGTLSSPVGVTTMDVDWVAFTAEGEKCLFPQSITCSSQ